MLQRNRIFSKKIKVETEKILILIYTKPIISDAMRRCVINCYIIEFQNYNSRITNINN